MTHLGFISFNVDHNVSIQSAVTSDGKPYYQYALLYIDDILVVIEEAKRIFRTEIKKYFTIKEGSISLSLG